MGRMKMIGRFSGAEVIWENGTLICDEAVKRNIVETAKAYEQKGCGVFIGEYYVGSQKLLSHPLTAYALISTIEPVDITEGEKPKIPESNETFSKKNVAKTFDEILKFNPYHDSRGRFASENGYATFTIRTKDPNKQYMADMAIARQKEKTPDAGVYKPKPKKNFDEHGFADYDEADYHQLYNGKQYYKQQQLTSEQKQAADNYLEAYTEPYSLYSHSQNMNYQMATGQTLTGKYKQTHDGLMSAMHNIGYNVELTRYDHADSINGMIKALGAGTNYEHMTQDQLTKALVGQTLNENKFISTSYNNFKNAPASTTKIFDSRAVKINYKVKADTKAMMPGVGPGGDFGEMILAPTNGTSNRGGKITAVRLTGEMVRRKGTQTYDQPRIEIDIEI